MPASIDGLSSAKKTDGTPGIGLVRAMNLQAVLEAIVEAGELSRPGAAEITGLSLPTATSLIADLETLGLVGNNGQVTGALGRPATLYSFNARAGYVFAVDLGNRKITAVIADLFGNMLLEHSEPTDRSADDSSAIVAQIARIHLDLVQRSGFNIDQAAVASIGVGGVWHPEKGTITDATNLPELGKGQILTELVEALSIPVILENDINLAAIGERWKGRAQGYDDFVVISVGSGIGMGIVLNGEIYRGANGAAGEIALLPIGADPYAPELQEHGAFETAAARSGILHHRDAVLASGVATSLSNHSEVLDILNAAADGDAPAQSIVDDEAKNLALGVVAAIAFLDPDAVVFGGSIGSHESLVSAIRAHLAKLVRTPPELVTSQLGGRGPLFGAVSIALQEVRTQLLRGGKSS